MTATQALTPGLLTAESVKLLVKLLDTLKPFAEVAEKLKHCHVVEICEPTPDNPSRNIIPMPREWFERAGDDLEYIAIQLHASGVLSEGQASKITGLDRVSVRREVDRLAPTAPVEASGSEHNRLKRAIADGISNGYEQYNEASPAQRERYDMAADAVLKLRPQPSGETREAISAWISDLETDVVNAERRRDRWKGSSEPGADYWVQQENELIDRSRQRLDLLSARPLALGGQQGVDEDWIRGLIGEAIVMNEDQERADEGDEELSRISDGVLKALRPHLSTTPARAEAQDEGAAGEPVGHIRGVDDILVVDWAQNVMPPAGTALYTHPSTTPAADADRVRIAEETLEAIVARATNAGGNWYGDVAAPALAALKSEAK